MLLGYSLCCNAQAVFKTQTNKAWTLSGVFTLEGSSFPLVRENKRHCDSLSYMHLIAESNPLSEHGGLLGVFAVLADAEDDNVLSCDIVAVIERHARLPQGLVNVLKLDVVHAKGLPPSQGFHLDCKKKEKNSRKKLLSWVIHVNSS